MNINYRRFCLSAVAALSFTTLNAQLVFHEVPITRSADDVEQQGDFIDLNDLELDLGWDMGEKNKIGLYFNEVDLEPNTTVEQAILRMVFQSALNDTLHVSIKLEEDAFPERYSDSVDISAGRDYFNDSVVWQIPPGMKGDTAYSPDLKDLVEACFALNDWLPTAHLNFLIQPLRTAGINDSTYRKAEFYAYDQNVPGIRPTLILETEQGNINGVRMVERNQRIDVYPNPSQGLCTVQSVTQVDRYVILDLQGRTVEQRQFAPSQRVDVEIATSGFYLMKVYSSDRLEGVKRLIVE